MSCTTLIVLISTRSLSPITQHVCLLPPGNEGNTEGERGEGSERVSAKINLQRLISLFELHLSYGAAASNHNSVNIQRMALYYLRLYVLFYLFALKFDVLMWDRVDTEEEGRMECEREKEERDGASERERERQLCQYKNGLFLSSVSIRCRACKYTWCAISLFINLPAALCKPFFFWVV